MGFRVERFRVESLGFRVWGVGFRLSGTGFGVQGSGFRVGSLHGDSGLGFRVQGWFEV